MQSNDYVEIRNSLQLSVLLYYKNLRRDAQFFKESKNMEGDSTYLHFLVDKTYVIRYVFGMDRMEWRGAVEVGIGPEYFSPSYFWSYENSTRFSYQLDTQSVFQNLRLLDDFWRSNKVAYSITP